MEIFIFVEWCMKNTKIDLTECAYDSNGVKKNPKNNSRSDSC